MALHAEITAALGMPVYFCEKASPGSGRRNENTNGLLRQYFPKGSDLRVHSPDELAAVAAELNARPRKTLGLGHPRRAAGPVTASLPHGCSGLRIWEDGRVADMRRRAPEPPPGLPDIQFKPGMADEPLRELAPLLAEEGIDVSNIDVPDLDTLQQALSRAVERHNMAMFTPVGHARDLAAVTMRLAAEAIADGDTALAAAVLDQVQPESPDGKAATVAGCIGARPRPAGPVAVRARHQRPGRPGRADPAARRALDRGTRRHRHPHPGPQGTRLRLPRRADRPARRPARPLRQRPHPRRGPPGLGTTRRHPAHRASPHCRPLTPIRSQPSVASVATMAGIRPFPWGQNHFPPGRGGGGPAFAHT